MIVWVSPGGLAWKQQHVLWLLEHYDELRNGTWPVQEGSYVDPAISKPTPSGHAPFIAAVEAAAEISRRLEDTGQDGVMVLLHYAYSQTVDAIGRYFRIPEDVVRYRMQMVLRRISRRNYRAGRYRRWNTGRGGKS